MVLEATHRSASSLDPAVVLLDAIVEVLVRPVLHTLAQHGPNRARVKTVTAPQHADRTGAGGRVGFLVVAYLLRRGERLAPWALRNFRISRCGCRHDSRPSASFCAGTRSDGLVRHHHETFSD